VKGVPLTLALFGLAVVAFTIGAVSIHTTRGMVWLVIGFALAIGSLWNAMRQI
jgi:hypothetical protein